MTPRVPIWPAARLNAELSHASGAPLAFTPLGEIAALEPFTTQTMAFSPDGIPRLMDEPKAVADIIALRVDGLATVGSIIRLLHPLLQCCALDPECWCIVIAHPGALGTVGPFRDVSAPLRDWLIRAAHLGLPIGQRIPSVLLRQKILDPPRPLTLDETLPLNVTAEWGVPPFPLPELVPAVDPAEAAWLTEHLEAFDAGTLGARVQSREDTTALAAGLWQINGFLERSHELAQSIEGRGRNRSGDYWHAIMHRREPDYGNAKYWFRKVGPHTIHHFLATDADNILAACGSPEAARWRDTLLNNGPREWDSLAFVDLCERLEEADDVQLSLAARQIQLIEMALLLSSTYRDAVAVA